MTTIKLKNGSGAPTAGDLVQGEPALDLTNKRLYTEDSGGTVIEVGTNPTSITTGDITATGTATFANLATSGDVTFGDNDKAIFGAGSDLQIYHDGSNSYVKESGAGQLIIAGSDKVQIYDPTFSTLSAQFDTNGSAKLYHNGSEKLSTTSTGIDVTGTAVTDGLTSALTSSGANVTVASLKNNGSGANTKARIDFFAASTRYAGISGGYGASAPQLSFDINGTDVLDINSTGIDVTGSVTADGLTVDGTLGDWSIDSQGVIQTFTRPSTSYIRASDASGSLRFDTGGSNGRLTIANNGDILFFNSAGTSQDFYWDASASSLGIGTTSPSATYSVDATKPMRIQTAAPSIELVETDAASQRWSMFGLGGDLTFRDITNNVYAMTLESSTGRVGIGTTSPTATLAVFDNTGSLSATEDVIAEFRRNDGTYVPRFQIRHSTAGTDLHHTYGSSASNMTFSIANNEKMRLDSSGNLLVGQSSSITPGVNNTTVGSAILSGGLVAFSRNPGPTNATLYVNRNTDDGDLVRFSKDGTKVGSIGSNSGDAFIGTGVVGVKFEDGNNAITPHRADTNVARDGATSLGTSSARFKDLYLYGGAYLGGTAAANYLDDYEEGTFTPTLTFGGASTGNVYGSQTGRYTKIGNIVHVFVYVRLTTKGTATGDAEISGLPFSADANAEAGTALNLYNNLANIDTPIIGRISLTEIELREGTTSTVTRLNDTNFTNSGEIRLSAAYRV